MKAIRLWMGVGATMLLALLLPSCGNKKDAPSTNQNIGVSKIQDRDGEIFLEEPNPGVRLANSSDLEAVLNYVFSQPRMAFIQHEAAYVYNTRRADGLVNFIRGEGHPIADEGNQTFELTASIAPSAHNSDFAINFTSNDGMQRNFYFRYDLNLYGFHLLSTESVALFETADNGPVEILKVALDPENHPEIAYVWRYRIVQNQSDFKPNLGGIPDPSFRSLQINQEELVVPLNSGNQVTVEDDGKNDE